MLFSSTVFLYYFLPIVLLIYFTVPQRLKNFTLLVASFLFYFYGEPVYSFLMILSSFSGYIHGLWINRAKLKNQNSKIPLISSIIFSLGPLIYFKYTDFFIQNANWFLNKDMKFLNLALPIGISFYTFQILSYTVDIYLGEIKVQRNLLNFTTYVALFPQLIAGPIVRYKTIERELKERKHSWENCAYGINRFIIGLSKKVILANNLGELGKILTDTGEKSVLLYWVLAFSFMLQIYFDFSGYSDMAIGLGRIFGFKFLENFNYPYISSSISEFWRRWHISLGTWFRDYVYIPMGGNRVNWMKWVKNIVIVWGLTGFWHGANWNFIIWGLYFAILLILEKYLQNIIKRIPRAIKHVYVLLFITISFVIFNAEGIEEAAINLRGMAGMLEVPFTNGLTNYYLRSYIVTLIVGVIASTPLLSKTVAFIKTKEKGKRLINTIEPGFHIILIMVITAFLIDGSFNPFLYFRF